MSQIIRFKHRSAKPPPIRVGIIVQARMGSHRFPGKMMKTLIDKPVLEWVLERIKLVRGPKRAKMFYILAVPDEDESEPMLELADRLKVDNFCGSELNVLRRYYDCARFFKLDVVVRITGDCPFIDPVVVSEVAQLLVWRKLDYTSNIHPTRTYPKGLDCEAFTMDCLEAAYKMAGEQLSDYEHVTSWMQRTPELKTGLVKQAKDMSHKNWCVDYPTDIQRLEQEILDSMSKPEPTIKLFGMEADNDTSK